MVSNRSILEPGYSYLYSAYKFMELLITILSPWWRKIQFALMSCVIVLFSASSLLAQIEICNNALDDDGDGLIDLNDSDCLCTGSFQTRYDYPNIIPNPSFESNPGPWVNGSFEGQPSYYTNDGPFIIPSRSIIPEQGIPPLPPPDGTGFIGVRDQIFSYKDYWGVSLIFGQLKKDSIYFLDIDIGFGSSRDRYESRSPFEVSLFGTPTRSDLPVAGFTCPLGRDDWVELGSAQVKGENEWVTTTITFIPQEDIHAILIGPSCTRAEGFNFYLIDNLILRSTPTLDYCTSEFEIIEDCGQIEFLTNSATTCNIQWYLNGIALPGQNNPVHVVDTSLRGSYQLMVTKDGGCDLSEPYIFEPRTRRGRLDTIICAGTSISIEGRSFDYEGNYTILTSTADWCDSIIDLRLKVKECYYVPNAFTPNYDGLNDHFMIFSNDAGIMIDEFWIYNKWGDKIFNASNIDINDEQSGWDGLYKGTEQNMGVYTYIFKLTDPRGQPITVTGDITLLR